MLAGIEGKINSEDVKGKRFSFADVQFFIGPSVQLKPCETININFVPMFGIREEEGLKAGEGKISPAYNIILIIGKEL